MTVAKRISRRIKQVQWRFRGDAKPDLVPQCLKNMSEEQIAPPSGPPPLLSDTEIANLCTLGFVELPSLPAGLSVDLKSLQESANEFFTLPEDTKRAQYPSTQGTELGYYLVQDEKEYITLRHTVHSPEPEIEKRAAECWKKIAALLYRALAEVSVELGVDLNAWDPILDGCRTLPPSLDEATPTLMRIFRYEPSTGIAEEHRDLGLLTLCVGTGAGLQVWQPSPGTVDGGYWKDATGPTILTGNVLRVLSGGRIPAGLHRVVGNPNGRNSIVFALRPSIRHSIHAGTFGLGNQVLETKDIWMAVKDRAYNINATKDIRDKKREELRIQKQAEVERASAAVAS